MLLLDEVPAALTYADILGVIPDSAIPDAIARDSEVTVAKARVNHTGTQIISTVSGLQGALDSKTTLVNPVGKTSAYTASPGEYVLAELAGSAWTLTLPANPVDKTRIGWKVVTQATPANVLTVTCGGSDRFNTTTGPASTTFVLLNQAAIAQYNAANTSWVIQSSDLALAQLDLRYVQVGTSQFDTRYERLLARGSRTTNSGASVGATPQRVLGLDAVPVLAGRVYRVSSFGGTLSPSAGSSFCVTSIVYTTDGSVPVAGSTQLASSTISTPIQGGGYTPPSTSGLYVPPIDGTIRPLITVAGYSGNNVSALASAANPLFLAVEDHGVAPAATGTSY